MDASGIILAGGKGRRLGGRDKCSETIGNQTLLERVISSLSFLESLIIVTGTPGQTLPEIEHTPPIRVVADDFPGKGPLGGIYSGLVASAQASNLVVACDMPFLNQELLKYLLETAGKFDVVVLRIGEELEPLHAVYRKSCIEPIKRLFEEGHFNIRRLFDIVKVRYVTAAEIERFDPDHLSYFNINTREELELALEISRQREK